MKTEFYVKQYNRRRDWEVIKPSPNQKIVSGAEITIQKALALSALELSVGEWITAELRKNPNIPSEVVKLLEANIKDEIRHDQVLANLRAVYPVDSKHDKIVSQLKVQANSLAEKLSPIVVAAALESSLFFCILPIYRFLGGSGFRSASADIAADENIHVATHTQLTYDLGYNRNEALNKLRKATVNWMVKDLPYAENSDNKYLSRNFWLRQSDNLYNRGKAEELVDTKKAIMMSFFETNNRDIPIYG